MDLQELPKHLQGASYEPLKVSSGASWGSPDRLLVPQGAPELQNDTSRASTSDPESLFDANLSSQLAFGGRKIKDFRLFSDGFVNIYVFDLKIVF